MKKVIVTTMVGGIILINTSVFSYDLGKSSGICKNSGNTETYYEEEEVVEESGNYGGTQQVSNGETSNTVKKYICKYLWKVVCVIVCMGPDHQTYTDCHQECRRILVNKSCRPYVE
jgi:hypothetical protein